VKEFKLSRTLFSTPDTIIYSYIFQKELQIKIRKIVSPSKKSFICWSRIVCISSSYEIYC